MDDKSCVLLVEGKDDLHVMRNLLFKLCEIPRSFAVELPDPEEREQDYGGVEKLLDSLPTRLRTADLQRLAVIVDADVDAARRWQSVRDRLLRAGVGNVPESYARGGTVAEVLIPPEPRKPLRFGVWIMPDNQSPGMLEDFVAQMIREDDDMLPEVDRFLDSIPAKRRRFGKVHRPKARIHTCLAVQKEPGKPMGQAIGAKKHFDTNRKAVDSFLSWINEALISDGPAP